ncbi:MAG: hypothetical protein JWQ90_4426 [Hydrocarboniphaga sp.]|uniref:BLUF domain-containing protein n=1 Tax=Hydrocarboniphaga sp. TaxID=2033016 RepID=UPI00260F3243|nr:BLUF domain-containing protein [Hydrocarboniphaga sp.]MDB5971976.1 hypothetical protein [Hydrocarboniphaga sp.]
MNDLIHCIYASAATAKYDKAAMQVLMASARRRNSEQDVSGMLLYTGDSFFQVLEGSESSVASMYERILLDPRHTHITKVIQEPIFQRSFASWTMGLAMLSRSEVRAISGVNDFFQGSSCLVGLDNGRAKKLLSAFSEGRWRSKVSDRAEAGADSRYA